MADTYCEKCGAELHPGDRFCRKCGYPVSEEDREPSNSTSERREPARDDRQGSQTRRSRRRPGCLSILGAIFVLLILGGIALYFYAPLAWYRLRVVLARGTVTKPSVTIVTKPSVTQQAAMPQMGPGLSDFADKWVTMQPQNVKGVAMTLQEQNGTITGYSTVNTQKIALTDLMGGKLSGTIGEGSQALPVTAELTNDRKQLILIIEHPGYDFEVVVAWREGAHPELRSVARAPKLGPNANSRSVTSTEEAISIVRGLPEVKDLLSKVPQSEVRFDATSQNPYYYTVRVSQITSNAGEGGTNTVGLYNIHKKTGDVYTVIP